MTGSKEIVLNLKMRVTVVAVLIGAVASLPIASTAANKADEDRRIEAAQNAVMNGTRLLKSGEYLKGIEAFKKAYQAFPQDRHLFVIASAYERVPNLCSQAIAAWQMYLNKCTQCKDRQAATQRMAKQQGLCAQKAPPQTSELDQVVQKAQEQEKTGNNMGAIMSYERAFRLKNDPSYLFAVASIYEKMDGRCADASLGWERFLSTCDGCAQRAEGLDRKQKNQERCQSGQQTKASSPLPVQPRQKASTVQPASPPIGSNSDFSNRSLFGYTGLALGGVAIIVGLNLSGEASDKEKKLQRERLEQALPPDEVKSREDDILSTENYSILAFSVGAVAVIAGGYFLLSEPTKKKKKGAYILPTRSGAFAGAYLDF